MKIIDAANVTMVNKSTGAEVFTITSTPAAIEGIVRRPYVFSLRKNGTDNLMYEAAFPYVGAQLKVEVDKVVGLYDLTLDNEEIVFTEVL
ncbi:hypothetical protein EVU96_08765 [Bacillus infantis]|uniref:hypothetical protein n=1 Tax=Bacillus infantis TaxID=324767 RepID=UPI00101B9F23|nr:hypothetical protein [Bacillus infantis]RYI30495.1 hypothetical protein EVU96_08765 [Bacillus infantis]